MQQSLVKRLQRILGLLETALTVDDMDVAGLRFHKLRGDLKDMYSVSVSGNWRIIFRFIDGRVEDIDLTDYQ